MSYNNVIKLQYVLQMYVTQVFPTSPFLLFHNVLWEYTLCDLKTKPQ